MPNIEDKINEDERDEDLEKNGRLHNVQDSALICLPMACSKYDSARKNQMNENTVDKCETEIDGPSFQFGHGAGSVGGHNLEE